MDKVLIYLPVAYVIPANLMNRTYERGVSAYGYDDKDNEVVIPIYFCAVGGDSDNVKIEIYSSYIYGEIIKEQLGNPESKKSLRDATRVKIFDNSVTGQENVSWSLFMRSAIQSMQWIVNAKSAYIKYKGLVGKLRAVNITLQPEFLTNEYVTRQSDRDGREDIEVVVTYEISGDDLIVHKKTRDGRSFLNLRGSDL